MVLVQGQDESGLGSGAARYLRTVRARESQHSLALKLTVGCYAEKPGTLMRGNLLQIFQDSSFQFLTFPAFSAVFMLDFSSRQ